MNKRLGIIFLALTASVGILSILSTSPAYAALKCGDPDVLTPCTSANVFNPKTADCSKVTNEAGQREQCHALVGCVVEKGKTYKECDASWEACVASYNKVNVNYAFCQSKIQLADFTNANKAGDTTGEKKTSCAVQGVGWIVCPAATSLAKITDGLYSVLTNLLEYKSSALGTNQPMYQAWSAMRTLANVAFVIAFIIIIYSQLTGVGISNYGIKKLLPRIIVAAILVNISFWVCAVAVDISNISGAAAKDLISGFIKDASITQRPTDLWEALTGALIIGTTGAVVVGGVVLGSVAAGGFWALLALLLPILVSVLFAIFTVVLVLSMRQALITILIVISPLAFVAYLLPNTAGMFDKWRKLFITLMVLYPVIGIIFGGSQLAAVIIRNSDRSIISYLLSLAVEFIPLFLTPIIMKLGGGVLNRIGAVVNNPNKGPFDMVRKRAEKTAERARMAGLVRGARGFQERDGEGKMRRGFRRAGFGVAALGTRGSFDRTVKQDTIDSSLKSALDKEKVNAVNAIARDNATSLAGPSASGSDITAVEAAAYQARQQQIDKETKDQEILIKKHPRFTEGPTDNVAVNALREANSTGNVGLAKAAQNILLSQQGTAGVDTFREEVLAGNVSTEIQSELRRNIANSHPDIKSKAADLDEWGTGGEGNLQAVTGSAKLWAGLSEAQTASQTPGSIKKGGESGGITAEKARAVMTNIRLAPTMKQKQKDAMQTIINKADQDAAYRTYNDNIR